MESQPTGKIHASSTSDPGLRDLFNSTRKNIEDHGHEVMENRHDFPNEGLVVSEYPQEYPASDHLFDIICHYKIDSQKTRNYVLIVEDMENGYAEYVRHCIPQVKALIDQFRQMKLPIVWTNWSRRWNDGHYNAVDRFYGPQGVTDQKNPCYIFDSNGLNGVDTVPELAPQDIDEISRSIASLHLSKFADYDENGREILFPMLEAWGVDTIIMVGAWTDDCLATTIFDAVDKYGYDVILVRDGVATATIHGGKMLDVLYSNNSCNMSTEEVIDYLNKNPERIASPKAPLNGNVRFEKMKYRNDNLLEELDGLKQRILELEAQISAK